MAGDQGRGPRSNQWVGGRENNGRQEQNTGAQALDEVDKAYKAMKEDRPGKRSEDPGSSTTTSDTHM